jgi:hypothetical protein
MKSIISHGISARVAQYQPEERMTRRLICHAIWILACIILCMINIYYQAKIVVVNKDKILKYI